LPPLYTKNGTKSKGRPPFALRTASVNSHMSLLLIHSKASLKTVHTSAGVNQLLSAGEKRMALGADFHPDILLGGTGLYDFATSTGNSCGLVAGMDSLFHGLSPLSISEILHNV
jgi:hypothetical protein